MYVKVHMQRYCECQKKQFGHDSRSWPSQDGELYLGEKNLRGVTGTPKLEDDGGPSKLQGPPFGRKND